MWRGPAVQRQAPEQALRLTVKVMAMPGVAWGSAGHGPAVSAARLSAALGWRRAWWSCSDEMGSSSRRVQLIAITLFSVPLLLIVTCLPVEIQETITDPTTYTD